MDNQGGGVYTVMMIIAFLAFSACATFSYLEYDEYLKLSTSEGHFKSN